MGQGSNKAMGKSSIFSGSGSKQGLSKKLGAAFYGEQDMSYPGGVPGPGKVTDSAAKPKKQNAVFNFSPPSNPWTDVGFALAAEKESVLKSGAKKVNSILNKALKALQKNE